MKDYKKMIVDLIDKIDQPEVLKDIYNLICAIYKHYISGTWET